jgi:hypothetical protein
VKTYEQTRDAFLDEMVRTSHTIDTYRRGIDLFIEFAPKPLVQLGSSDKAILVKFTQWLLDECGLAPSSARLYLSSIRRWFEWLSVNDHFPDTFPLAKALWSLSDALAGSTFRADRRPPEPAARRNRAGDCILRPRDHATKARRQAQP